ncbi:Ltp family lipoprotein [Paenibacillus woosongensis]|nr:Ltp family lipoprotein [Paenibacillus woosongensis]
MFIGLISFIACITFTVIAIVSVAKKNGKAKKQFVITAALFVIFIIAVASDPSTAVDKADNKDDNAPTKVAAIASDDVTEDDHAKKEIEEKAKLEAEKKEKEEKAKLEAEEKAKKEAEDKEKSIPREHRSALKKAELYAESMHMSKAAIYDQLTSEYGENFPQEAAQYAVDNIVFDWKENALKKAQLYAESMDMSNSAIYDQLISEYGEKFTAEEAQYAIDNLE